MINRRRLTYLILFIIVAWLSGSYLGSIIATAPHSAKHPPASEIFNFQAEEVSFITSDGIRIAAWYLPNSKENAVILLNGYQANRRGMVERAKIYHAEGFSVLLPDLRGTGESEAAAVTIGWMERLDLKAGTDFLREKGHEKIAVHGISLGAATIAYSLQDNPDYWFSVLESCYDNLDQTFDNRLNRFHIPPVSSELLRYCTEWRIGVESEQLNPQHYLKRLECPVLFLAGDSEYKVKKQETESIFASCGSSEKQLHFFKGAMHEDFLKYDPEEFAEVLGCFLAERGL